MRVRLILKDRDYLKALTESVGMSDIDVYVEIGSITGIRSIDDRTLILTDYPEKMFVDCGIKDPDKRIVFMTSDPYDRLDTEKRGTYYRLFKYSSMSEMFSNLEQINYLWTGENGSTYGLITRIYAVCSDLSDHSSRLSQALARQILFRRGGSILIISLKYVNEYADINSSDNSIFSRMLYYMDIEKEYPYDSFTYKDSYGISYLRIPPGLNPVAYMSSDEVIKMVRNLSMHLFETVILDVGNEYSKNNIMMLNRADNIVFFDNSMKAFRIDEIFKSPEITEKVYTIQMNEKEKDIDLRIDDYVRAVYGIEDAESEDDKKKSNKKILS